MGKEKWEGTRDKQKGVQLERVAVIKGGLYIPPEEDEYDNNDLLSDEFKAFMKGNSMPTRKEGVPATVDPGLSKSIQDLKVVFSHCDQIQKKAIALTISVYAQNVLRKL